MKLVILKISLALLLMSCSFEKDLHIFSKYETVYSTSIDEQEYNSIYEVLKNNFADFPEKKNGKIIYTDNNEDFLFKVKLNDARFRMVYKSDKGYNEQIDALKAKVKSIVD